MSSSLCESPGRFVMRDGFITRGEKRQERDELTPPLLPPPTPPPLSPGNKRARLVKLGNVQSTEYVEGKDEGFASAGGNGDDDNDNDDGRAEPKPSVDDAADADEGDGDRAGGPSAVGAVDAKDESLGATESIPDEDSKGPEQNVLHVLDEVQRDGVVR